MKRITATLLVVFIVISFSVPAFALDQEAEITADVLLVRPVSLVATVLGTALFMVALPFSIPSGSVGSTAQALIAEPFKYTFMRPVGDTSENWEKIKTDPMPEELFEEP
jgi:hypothetical protein